MEFEALQLEDGKFTPSINVIKDLYQIFQISQNWNVAYITLIEILPRILTWQCVLNICIKRLPLCFDSVLMIVCYIELLKIFSKTLMDEGWWCNQDLRFGYTRTMNLWAYFRFLKTPLLNDLHKNCSNEIRLFFWNHVFCWFQFYTIHSLKKGGHFPWIISS